MGNSLDTQAFALNRAINCFITIPNWIQIKSIMIQSSWNKCGLIPGGHGKEEVPSAFWCALWPQLKGICRWKVLKISPPLVKDTNWSKAKKRESSENNLGLRFLQLRISHFYRVRGNISLDGYTYYYSHIEKRNKTKKHKKKIFKKTSDSCPKIRNTRQGRIYL